MNPITRKSHIIKYHCIRNGMWDVFNVQPPQDTTNKVDIFSHIGLFMLEKIQSFAGGLRGNGGQRHIEALDWSGIYMRESLHVIIFEKTLQRISTTYPGSEFLNFVFEVIDVVYFEQMEQLKAGLKLIKFMDFPGENVTDSCLKIRYYCERLDNAGYWDEKRLVKLLNIFMSFTDYNLRLWYLTSSTNTMKYIEKCTF